MRKLVYFLVPFLIVFSIIPGCGKKNKEASETLNKIDSTLSTIDKTVNEFSGDLDELVQSIESGTELTVSLLEETYNTFIKQGKRIQEQVRKAQQETDEILKMEGMPDYKKYVDIQNQILRNAVSITAILADFTNELSTAVKAVSKGEAPDSSKLATKAKNWSKELDELIRKSKELEEKARQLREETGI
ncbi:MAG: hypothetical protein PHP64_07215 [Actinomycetota bacterium]|nr:hypothetical protein [Actinomycetota bacterium]